MSERAFPAGFVWGAATASYQIEGGVAEDGRSESIWDRFSHTPGKIVDGDTGDIACDHYHRWPEDIAIMRELGLHAYRFSLAWPRIVPAGRGAVHPAGLDFYDRLVDALLEAGIQPWATLYHWDLPQVLQDEGGWTNRAVVDAFTAYTDAATRRLGDRVKHWLTINEPWCASFLSYQLGVHAPGWTDWGAAVAAAHHLLLGHGAAVPVVRGNVAGATVGIVLNPTTVYPNSDAPEDIAATHRFDGYMNRWFLDPLYGRGYPADMLDIYGAFAPPVRDGDLETIAAHTDLLGINFYSPSYITAASNAPLRARGVDRPEFPHTAMGWIVEPRGLRDLILRLHRDYPTGPIFVTENGAAFDDPAPVDGRVPDPNRIDYLRGHIDAVLEAIAAGAPVDGYFVWSLLDNFEWAEGYAKRFGIVYVDFESLTRTPKASAGWYRNAVAGNAIPD